MIRLNRIRSLGEALRTWVEACVLETDHSLGSGVAAKRLFWSLRGQVEPPVIQRERGIVGRGLVRECSDERSAQFTVWNALQVLTQNDRAHKF
jgi:hypothetical protein